jgi:hypothetical protein
VNLKIRLLLVTVCGLCCLVSAEDDGPKAGIRFFGEIQSGDTTRRAGTVKHVEIPGYAVHGTSDYRLTMEPADDGAVVLKRLRNDISTTLHPNGRTLHNTQLIRRRREN